MGQPSSARNNFPSTKGSEHCALRGTRYGEERYIMNTTAQTCSHCPHSQILVWQDRRRCIACGAWVEDDQHISTYYVVNRDLHILLNHGFVVRANGNNGRIIKEVVIAKQRPVEQHRLEFQLPESMGTTAVLCSVRWFKIDKRIDYQYLNKVSRRVLDSKPVPEEVRSATRQLVMANTQPGSLRITEVNLSGDFEGSKFVRMEQSYTLNEATAHDTSLIVRAEFSWF